jgi:hypothetical protein
MISVRPIAARMALAPILAPLAAGGCSKAGPKAWQGYLEGDFVYVASPLAGRLERLAAEKGLARSSPRSGRSRPSSPWRWPSA